LELKFDVQANPITDGKDQRLKSADLEVIHQLDTGCGVLGTIVGRGMQAAAPEN
jgi:hypothetical protein